MRCEEIGLLWKGDISWPDRDSVKRNSEKKANETDLILKARASLTWAGQMLGTRWRSDNHIKMMVEELKTNWNII